MKGKISADIDCFGFLFVEKFDCVILRFSLKKIESIYIFWEAIDIDKFDIKKWKKIERQSFDIRKK